MTLWTRPDVLCTHTEEVDGCWKRCWKPAEHNDRGTPHLLGTITNLLDIPVGQTAEEADQ